MDWLQYARNGDEWFYAAIALQQDAAAFAILSPCLFAAAHALELYIKAAVLKRSGYLADDNGKPLHLGKVLWERAADTPGFPVAVQLRWDLLKTYCAFDGDLETYATRSREEAMHLMQHRFLYEALRHVTDLKYLRAGGSTLPKGKPTAYLASFPDAQMSNTLQTLRQWLGHTTFMVSAPLDALLRSHRILK